MDFDHGGGSFASESSRYEISHIVFFATIFYC